MKLHLGCGQKHFKGWLNVDGFSRKADKRFNFEKTPWPLKANSFDAVYSSHCLEHLDDTQKAMEEIWRVCKPGAKVTIRVPHFSSMFAFAPFHKKFFARGSMLYFTSSYHERYGKANFEIVSTRIHWYPQDPDYIKGAKRKFGYYFGKFLDVLINASQDFFERVWCHWVGGAYEIEWRMKAKK
jgi:SAM-dependent methyltransferase